eukprot:m.488267 g.488267  ORF g.488267 m.488267 type:complete len:337 (+) comp25687_c0_seq1:273-1283(+)
MHLLVAVHGPLVTATNVQGLFAKANVGHQFVDVWLRGGQCLFRILGDLFANLLFLRLELILCGPAGLDNAVAHAGDRVKAITDGLDVSLGAVRVIRVTHRVAVVAVSFHFHDDGAVLDGKVLCKGSGLLDGKDVHGIDPDAGHVVATRVVLGRRRRASVRSTHAKLIVLTHKDARDVPQLGNVVRLKHLALVGGTVTVEGDADTAVVFVLVGKGDASADGNLGTDNAVATKEAGAVHVHRASLAARAARRQTVELTQDGLGRPPHDVCPTVAPVRCDNGVVFIEGGAHAHGNGLLARVEVEEPTDLLLTVHGVGLRLHPADHSHLFEHRLELILLH